jgi:uncharacterized protein (TIGR02145 family)
MKQRKKNLIYIMTLFGVMLFIIGSCKKEDKVVLPTVTTTQATQITATGAISGGTVTDNGGASVTARGVCWSTNPNPTIADAKTEDGAGAGSFTSNISGLEANKIYYIRSYATNSAGTGYGNQIEITTLLGIEVPVLTTVSVTEIDRHTAKTGGNITSDGGGEVTSRGVCWSTSQNPTIAGSKTEDGNGIGAFISNIADLESNTTYYIRAYATNAAGTGYGNEVSFKTLEEGIVIDIDGNIYQTVIIGNQEWMAENLRVRTYNSGDPIPTNLDNETWTTTNSGAFTVFDFNNSNAAGIDSEAQMASIYGLLYNWFAVGDVRSLCPSGWRVPSSDDWNQMSAFIIEQQASIDTSNLARALKSCRQINSPLGGECATDQHPFWREDELNIGEDLYNLGLLPAGFRHNTSGNYSWLTSRGYWWTSTEFETNPESANYRRTYFSMSVLERIATSKRIGFSVRCIKDK